VARLILLVVVSVCVVFCVLCFVLPKKKIQCFVHQITTGKKYNQKKRYSRLAVGWNKSQNTCCAWAGGTDSQFVVEKIIRELPNT
jgi:hypothetical protein